jgi:hypothetical protein
MLAGGSALVAALTTGVYVVVIQQEGDDPFWEIFPWVMIMLIGTSSALASALSRNPGVGRFAATAAAVILGILGVVAMFSFGLGFVIAAVLALLSRVTPSPATARAS